ncbi:HTH-type transcriptional regulator [Fictibacillus macauensis ZFHKF-1]|uniref:HTH-type transcriptional regulator n=1 Tax=Fictibacillus macauensis ZFHKF-1 TaxID=1196324 RepID=I8AJM1_9BACL|nr:LysR family transcriptional regulator [Fictibacillus macauensis]EIT85962.1 HTH-type transcriptional regulator [Fictibacillus macauensis ZFHKF-1]
MDVRQLLYFVEVSRQKSFTKAANILFLSQPSLSKMVKSLEEELQVQLLDRSGRQLQLTDAGEAVYEHALRILHAMDELSSSLYDVLQLKKGKITLGIPPVISTLYFPKIIGDFKKKYPQITMQLMEYGANKMEEEVANGTLDLGISVLPVDEEAFDVLPFKQDEMTLIVSAEHPFAKAEKVSLNQLEQESFIFFTEEFALYDRMVATCRQAGFEPTIAYKSSQWDFMAGLVGENMGISFLPHSLYNKLHNDNIVSVSLEGEAIPWHLGIVMKKGKYKSYALRQFLAHLQS